jgi:hypothetical protein
MNNDLRAVAGYDRLTFRLAPSIVTRQQTRLELLKRHSTSAYIRPGSAPRDFERILTVVNPREPALKLLGEACGLTPRVVELALDLIVPSQEAAQRLHELFDEHFVQARHGKRETTRYEDATTYTGDEVPGHYFAWYSDRASKLTGDPYCLHLEARYVGIVALRQIGLDASRNLLTFDHVAFWRKHLKLYEIDLARLGRYHENRCAGERRQQDQIFRNRRFIYNQDQAIGSLLYRNFGLDTQKKTRSVQRFVDQHGRGPYLREMETSPLLEAIITGV